VERVGREQDADSAQGRERARGTKAGPAGPADAESREQSGDEREGEEGSGGVSDAELIVAKKYRERLGHARAAATLVPNGRGRVVVTERGVVALELPPVDRRVARERPARPAEPLSEVRGDVPREIPRLMHEHPAREVSQHGVAAFAGREHDPSGVRAVMGVLVDAPPLVKRLFRAQHPLVVGQVEPAAVDDRRSPAVEQERVAAVEPDTTRLDAVVRRVHPDGDCERQGERRRPDDPGPSSGSGDQRERDRRQYQHPTHDADGHGQTEQHTGDRECGKGEGASPEQQHDRREQECFEQRLGHDVLLDLQLVRIEQDRYGGEHGDPPTRAEPDEHGIDRDAHGQAENVLHGGDASEGADREHRAQEKHDVADRLGLPRAEVVQVREVPERIDEQQRRPVRDLRHGAKQRPDAENNEEDPVPACADANALSLLGSEPALTPVEARGPKRRR